MVLQTVTTLTIFIYRVKVKGHTWPTLKVWKVNNIQKCSTDSLHNMSLLQIRPRRTSPKKTLTSTWEPQRRRRRPSPSSRSSESSKRRNRWWNHNRARAGQPWLRAGPTAPSGQGDACQINCTVLGRGSRVDWGRGVADDRPNGNLPFAFHLSGIKCGLLVIWFPLVHRFFRYNTISF